MTDFEYDCLQKKRIANQAKYRKRGSKSKKCNLPSDRLTQKQWKDKCGPVVSFNFNRPMNWETFKKLPAMVQAEYITNLQKKFGATAVDLGKMFGVQALTVRKHAESNKLNVEFPRGHAMNATRKEAWAKFLGEKEDCVVNNIPAPVHEQEDTEPEHHVFNTPESTEEEVHEPAEFAPIQRKGMNMKKFTLQFAGVIDANMIANSLKLILGDQAEGELEIICNLA
jgi:hypothetical protein